MPSGELQRRQYRREGRPDELRKDHAVGDPRGAHRWCFVWPMSMHDREVGTV